MLFWEDSQSAHYFLKRVLWHSLYCIDLVMKRGLFYFIFLLVAWNAIYLLKKYPVDCFLVFLRKMFIPFRKANWFGVCFFASHLFPHFNIALTFPMSCSMCHAQPWPGFRPPPFPPFQCCVIQTNCCQHNRRRCSCRCCWRWSSRCICCQHWNGGSGGPTIFAFPDYLSHAWITYV